MEQNIMMDMIVIKMLSNKSDMSQIVMARHVGESIFKIEDVHTGSNRKVDTQHITVCIVWGSKIKIEGRATQY